MELLGKSKEELRAFCAALGEPAYRGVQIYHALYAERKFTFAGMTNLPGKLRERLQKEATITLPMVRQRYVSRDGSVRYLFALGTNQEKGFNAEGEKGRGAETARQENEFNTEDTEGRGTEGTEKRRTPLRQASVEAVFMPSEGRQTICVSTQAGCAVDCQFCLTAQLGLIRNLTAGEILAQVLVALEEYCGGSFGGAGTEDASRKTAVTHGENKRTNIVLMGQGEPLLNFENVMAAMRILLDPEGMGISPKHATLSTSGIVPGIERLAQEPLRPKLAISLNASNDEQRDRLMPINRKYPLKTLLAACANYPLRTWEHLTFEYVLLGGVNDSAEDARRVVKLLAPLKRVKVNLIPWNPGELPFRETDEEKVEEFRRILNDKGVPAFVRYSRGRDVMAACGQLALKEVGGRGLSVIR